MLLFASLILALLPFAEVANSAYTPCTSNCIFQASVDELENMALRLYNERIDQYTEVPIGRAAEFADKIDKSKPTVVYIYGWLEFQNPQSTEAIINAFLSLNRYNVMLLNWSEISNNIDYIFSAQSTEGVGYYLANALSELVALGLNEEKLEIVGHSLGGQVCGFTGRYVNFTLEKITGLDPAGPEFYDLLEHLASGDAKFVSIIHTDRGGLGINVKSGDVDFYPNDGVSPQPGCLTLDYCSHYRAVFYYAESVTNQTAFIGRMCDSYSDFKAGLCSSEETAVMGYGTPTNTRGNFYLQTNERSPYGRGKDGATYKWNSLISSIVDEAIHQAAIPTRKCH